MEHTSRKETDRRPGDGEPRPHFRLIGGEGPTEAAAADLFCASCGKQGSSKSRFCGGCGSLLWEPCLACGEVNAVGFAYCGSCGGDLKATLDEATASLSHTVEQAKSLFGEGRVQSAVETLDAVRTPEHTALRTLVSTARRLRDEFLEMKERAATDSLEIGATAQALIDESDFGGAIETISKIPAGLRDSKLTDLHNRATSSLADAKKLRAEIKQRIADKEYDGLLPVVLRLKTLAPADAQVAKLYSQLEAREKQASGKRGKVLIGHALKALAVNDYPTAGKLLEQAPAEPNDPEVARAAAEVRETVWLARQLALAPHADANAAALAQKFAKRQPRDERLQKTVVDFVARARRKPTVETTGPTPWAKPPAVAAIGESIDLLPFTVGLALAAEGTGAAPAQLTPSYGLALQALGRAELVVDLSPKPSGGWAKKLALGLGRKGAAAGWGVDAGARVLKAVKLVASEEGQGPPKIEAIYTADIADTPEGHADAVGALLAEHEFRGLPVAINIPAIQTLGRFFSVPVPDSKQAKFDEVVRYEARARIPLETEKSVQGYYSVDEKGEDPGLACPQRRVALMAAKLEDAQLRVAPWRTAGASRVTVASEALALVNAEACRRGGVFEPGEAILDVGHKSSIVAAYGVSGPWFRSFYGGVEDFNREIAKAKQITLAEADALRREIHKAPLSHEIDALLVGAYEAFAGRLVRVLNTHHSECGAPITKLLLCGGGAESYGLVRYLRNAK
ncbi:hypothetical protein Mal64_19610 [Pseudobythopirellula maris]|uniref:DZANK-type domain-containing protein n=1 Tax=Pseudobythopirellula maris TaxID=2527991 RepID=A0A5C5ZMU0_9BACT|nr:zinc ribbon domain-containing protein [Pseudobythopirellula maris]TWT88478.1 hypothetical protein Mal64_19610 [Pseudobythopirellula maris]